MYRSIWISGLRTINKVLFGIILLVGIIGAVVAGVEIGGFVGFLAFVGILCVAGISAFMTVAVLMVFLDIAEDIGVIARNTRQTNIPDAKQKSTFFDVFEEEKRKKYENMMLNNGGWRCGICGKVNAKHTGTCGCGNNKYNNEGV